MFKCNKLLVLCFLNENMKTVLVEIPKCLIEVISTDFLLYLNIFSNFGGKRFPLDCEGPAFAPAEVPQGLWETWLLMVARYCQYRSFFSLLQAEGPELEDWAVGARERCWSIHVCRYMFSPALLLLDNAFRLYLAVSFSSESPSLLQRNSRQLIKIGESH